MKNTISILWEKLWTWGFLGTYDPERSEEENTFNNLLTDLMLCVELS